MSSESPGVESAIIMPINSASSEEESAAANGQRRTRTAQRAETSARMVCEDEHGQDAGKGETMRRWAALARQEARDQTDLGKVCEDLCWVAYFGSGGAEWW